ncbi:MAG: N-formylglutamate amidohydrolase [Flavobacteriaceae bacterium]
MEKLSVQDIIKKINNQEIFHAVADDYSFTLKIENYVHYVCGAVHDGHQFRKSLWLNCLHTEYERWYEEDPYTKQMIQSHPIVIAGCDSRFEYDLNRDPESAIYADAWGKKLWKLPLSQKEKNTSLQKHDNFYKVVYALINKLEQLHSNVIVYDMHSYNWKRWTREVPTFNLGAENVEMKQFGHHVEAWRETLSQIELPNGIKSSALINDVFKGHGYFLKFITLTFKNTLVLATEVSKVYCDELNQINFPEVINAIEEALKIKLKNHAVQFIKDQ